MGTAHRTTEHAQGGGCLSAKGGDEDRFTKGVGLKMARDDKKEKPKPWNSPRYQEVLIHPPPEGNVQSWREGLSILSGDGRCDSDGRSPDLV